MPSFCVIRVVLVEPHYAGNVGSVARLMKNFEAGELYLVNPHVSPLDDEALRWAVHAKDVLEKARVVSSLEAAIEGSTFVAATTGRPHEKSVSRTPMTPKQFAQRFGHFLRGNGVLTILFGREPSGLTNEEMQMADFTVTIPASPVYPILNLSHAVGVILYELYVHGSRYRQIKNPPRAENIELLHRFFGRLVDIVGRDRPDEVKRIFRAVVARGARTDREVRALIGVLADALRRWENAGGDKAGV